ncbi:MAG: tRNA lysidine(34) synthetase TilS [Opitutae bacterium]|nr:tRNA lysidine(34) synthetase TilS [Opitutae bacterium]
MPTAMVSKGYHWHCQIEEMPQGWSFPEKSFLDGSFFEPSSGRRIPEDVSMTLNSAIKSGKRLGIACSGGADSVFLVLLIYSEFIHLRQSLNLCHFNHKLRGRESNLDERYVKELSKYLKIPFHRGTALTHGKSDEGTLRNLRLNFFRDAGAQLGFSLLAMGHHADDVAETLLWRLPRASTVSGLIAPKTIDYQNDLTVVRPLLKFSREDIRSTLQKNNFPWREDKSNFSDKYLRNRIRNWVVPAWKEALDRDLLKGISKTRELLEQDSNALEIYAIEAFKQCLKGTSIRIDEFNSFPIATRRRILRLWVTSTSDKKISFGGKESNLLQQIHEGKLRTPCLSKELRITLKNGLLYLSENKRNARVIPLTSLPPSQELHLPNGKKLSSTFLFLDERKLREVQDKQVDQTKDAYIQLSKSILFVRSRKAGDRFQKLGSKGNKKVSEIMIDLKWKNNKKEETPVILTTDMEIVWIPGLAPSEKFKITAQSNQVIRLTYT